MPNKYLLNELMKLYDVSEDEGKSDFFVHVYMYMGAHMNACSHRTICNSQFCLYTMWVLGPELGHQSWWQAPFTC